MAENNNKEILNLDALKHLTGVHYNRAEAYDFTRNAILKGNIDWENIMSDRVLFYNDCESLAKKFNDFATGFGDIFANLEFVGPIVLCNYSYINVWVESDKERANQPIIGANLAVRNTQTGKLELLNRNGWFVHREWLSSYGSMLMQFFRTMRDNNAATQFNFERLLAFAGQSRANR